LSSGKQLTMMNTCKIETCLLTFFVNKQHNVVVVLFTVIIQSKKLNFIDSLRNFSDSHYVNNLESDFLPLHTFITIILNYSEVKIKRFCQLG